MPVVAVRVDLAYRPLTNHYPQFWIRPIPGVDAMQTPVNHQFRLARRPVGMVQRSDFDYVEAPVAEPGDGEVLVKILYISLDPAMRGWMNEGKSYVPPVAIGEVMRAGAVGRVLASKDPGVAGPRPPDVQQSEIGGHARHAECAEVHGQRRQAGIDPRELLRLGDRVFLHAEHADDMVAHGDPGIIRRDHAPHGACAHDFADTDRRHVGLALVHPAAHRGVERDVQDLHQHLAVAGCRDRSRRVLEVGALDHADRAPGELELVIDGVGHGGVSGSAMEVMVGS